MDEAIAFTNQWIEDIANFTPASCNCSSNWANANYTIDCSSAEAHFQSGWEAHDRVSERLIGEGKKVSRIPFDQALRLWSGPKVAFLSSSYLSIGGTEIFHRMLIPRLREYVNVIGFASTAFHGGDGSLLKVPYVMGTEKSIALADRADVVITWGIDTVGQLLPNRKQRVISVHHSDASSKWSNRLQLLPCVDEVVCVNRDTAKFLHKETDNPIHYIPNCVDPERIQPSVTREELRNRCRIPTDAKVVLFGHRLSEEKQPRKAVEIAHALPGDWVMVLVGSGELAGEFASNDRVRVVGSVMSLADWFAAADVFISLSTYEGYGLSVAEALAFGIPTVSTPRGIAVDRAIPCEACASVAEWCAAIVAAYGTQPTRHEDLCDIDRFIDQWVNVCHGSSN